MPDAMTILEGLIEEGMEQILNVELRDLMAIQQEMKQLRADASAGRKSLAELWHVDVGTGHIIPAPDPTAIPVAHLVKHLPVLFQWLLDRTAVDAAGVAPESKDAARVAAVTPLRAQTAVDYLRSLPA